MHSLEPVQQALRLGFAPVAFDPASNFGEEGRTIPNPVPGGGRDRQQRKHQDDGDAIEVDLDKHPFAVFVSNFLKEAVDVFEDRIDRFLVAALGKQVVDRFKERAIRSRRGRSMGDVGTGGRHGEHPT